MCCLIYLLSISIAGTVYFSVIIALSALYGSLEDSAFVILGPNSATNSLGKEFRSRKWVEEDVFVYSFICASIISNQEVGVPSESRKNGHVEILWLYF